MGIFGRGYCPIFQDVFVHGEIPVQLSPIALAASLVQNTFFTANWITYFGATGYFVDISFNADFSNIVPGYSNILVSSVPRLVVSGLIENTTYYYRVRAVTVYGTTGNSNIIDLKTSIQEGYIPSVLTVYESRHKHNCENITVTGNVINFDLYAYDSLHNHSSDNLHILTYAVPVATSATKSLINSFVANWGMASGAIGYYVDVSLVSDFSTYVSGYQNLYVGNVFLLNVTGLLEVTTYYYRVRAYYTDYTTRNSNTISCMTSYALGISSRGNGSGVTSLNLEVSADVVLNITANGRFYTDSIGTLNESTSFTVLAGATRTLYMKCVSGDGIISLGDPTKVIKLGGYGGAWYPGGYNSPTLIGNPLNFSNLTEFNFSGGNLFSLKISDIPSTITYFSFAGLLLTGSISEIPSSVRYFYSTGTSSLTGNLNTLKSGLLEFEASLGSNSITGSIASVYSTLRKLVVSGSNTVSGSINTISSSLTFVSIEGGNTISGDIQYLSRSLTYFLIGGYNTITGDIASLPSTITLFQVLSTNAIISGDIVNAPSSLVYFGVGGRSTVHGNVANIPIHIGTFNNLSLGSMTGNISDIPVSVKGFQVFTNTLSGNLSTLKSSIIVFMVYGSNTISGDLKDLPINIYRFELSGNNTVSDYTTGRTFPSTQILFSHYGSVGYGLSTAKIDGLLIDLSAASWNVGGILSLLGSNASRSSVSDSAVSILQGKGVSVYTK